MKILHVNLARGFRGGERQTELLIRALAERKVEQVLVCQPDYPLYERLQGTPGLNFQTATSQLAGHRFKAQADVVHAHEAKGVHWAWLEHRLNKTPYILTRRVDTPVRTKWLNRQCYTSAARNVAISNLIAGHLKDRNWSKVELVPSVMAKMSADPEVTAAFRAQFPDKFILGHIGALVDKHKGQRLLIEAARQLKQSHPQIQVVFFGDGVDEAAFKAESADLDNISWMGFKPNIGDYMPGLDLFAFPSRNEGLGSVLFDVMNAGVPIVAAKAGGIPDIIHHEKTGLLVPAENAQALYDSIVRLYESLALRQQLVEGARAHLVNYTPEVMAQSYMTIYQSILNKHSD